MGRGGGRKAARNGTAAGGKKAPNGKTRRKRKAAKTAVGPGAPRTRRPARSAAEPVRGAPVRRKVRVAKGGKPTKRKKAKLSNAHVTHLMYRGKRRKIVLVDGPPFFKLKGGKFLVIEPPGADRNRRIRKAYREWLQARGEKYLPMRTTTLGDRYGIWPKRVTVRQQSTRWGSATSKGTLSLNSMILMLPTRLANYVILHELCHLLYTDHSPEYWMVLKSIYPNIKQATKELAKYAREA